MMCQLCVVLDQVEEKKKKISVMLTVFLALG